MKQNTFRNFRSFSNQVGVTLIELLAALAIAAIVVSGGLSLYNMAVSSSSGTAMVKGIIAIRASTQQLFMGQGSYGTGSVNATLITANKVPADFTTATPVIHTTLSGGTLTVTGATSSFTIAVDNVPNDVCTTLLTNLSAGWSQVKVDSSAAIVTFPVPPVTAASAANCGGAAPHSITWTTSN